MMTTMQYIYRYAYLGNLPSLLSLACSSATNTVYAGTELVDHQASILIWSVPSPALLPVQLIETSC